MLQLHNTVNLGGTASNIAVARIGVSINFNFLLIAKLWRLMSIFVKHGLMRMTCGFTPSRYGIPSNTALRSHDRWRPDPVSDEVAFEAIKTGLDSLPAGAKMLLNSSGYH